MGRINPDLLLPSLTNNCNIFQFFINGNVIDWPSISISILYLNCREFLEHVSIQHSLFSRQCNPFFLSSCLRCQCEKLTHIHPALTLFSLQLAICYFFSQKCPLSRAHVINLSYQIEQENRTWQQQQLPAHCFTGPFMITNLKHLKEDRWLSSDSKELHREC